VPNGDRRYHFGGTFSGSNGIDSWHGTAQFDRYIPDPKLSGSCTAEAADAVYCYRVVSGTVTWTVEGVTKVVSLAPPDGTDGIQLILSSATHPERAGTYEIGLGMSTDVAIELPNGTRYAFENVRAWISAIKYPKYAADWHLAGTEGTGSGCGIDGCGAGATWTWDLVATFDP
jgi:hypothetical protein